MAREFARVGVIGLGTMGAGIVEVFARSGIEVVAVEIAADALERGRTTLDRSLDRAIGRGKLSQVDADALLGRVAFAVGLDALSDVDLVIEAVPERLDIKRRLFADLDRICKPDAILATNTSSLPVTEIAVASGRPARVLGMHFFNPAPVMRLIEIVTTVITAAEVAEDVAALAARLDKTGVVVGDRAGFVANALLFGYLNHAVTMFEAGHASREDIDAAMKLGYGLPMGPLTLLDLIGLDTSLEILETMYARGGHSRRHPPAPLLRQMVTAGLLGRKAGRGFYAYEKPGSAQVVPEPVSTATAPSAVRGVTVVGQDSAELAEALVAAGYEVTSGTPDDLSRVGSADLVVAGADIDPAALGAAAKPGAILALIVTDAPVIERAVASDRPADVIGLHLLGTAAVEVVRTVCTAPDAVDAIRDVAVAIGRHPVICGDRAGFVADALLFGYLNDAVRMTESGYASTGDIDAAMKLGCGYPAGPFEMLDEIGLDVVLGGLRRLFDQEREPALAPASLLEQLVVAGRSASEPR